MAETQNLVLQYITLLLAALLVIGSFTWFATPVIECPTCPELPELEMPEINLTSIEESIADIQSTLDEDEEWEKEAEDLAIEELEKRDYKDLFNWMSGTEDDEGNLSIEDRDDIDKVIIKDVTIKNPDSDDKDATVNLKLRVYYENFEGDDKKKTIYAQAKIEDGEVEDLEFSLTEE